MKTIRVRTSYTGCRYITSGKAYECRWVEEFGDGASVYGEITLDDGTVATIVLKHPHVKCGLLGAIGDWEIISDGPTIADELAEALEEALLIFTGLLPLSERGGPHDEIKAAKEKAKSALAKHKESKQ